MYSRIKLTPIIGLISVAAAVAMIATGSANAGVQETFLPRARSDDAARALPKYNLNVKLDRAAQRKKSARELEKTLGMENALDRQSKIEPIFVLRF